MSNALANQLFLTYLGRPADAAWRSSTASLLNGNQPSAALQKAFYNAAVSEGVFASTDSNSTLVKKVFLQTFGFAASTFEQTAWADLVTKGTVSKETLAWTIFVSYLGATNVPDQYKLPTQSKLIAIDAYTNQLTNDATANLALAKGGSAADVARTQIATVTSQATAATFVIDIVANVAENDGSTGETFTLTTDEDTFSGTSGDDTFVATTDTMDAEDRIVDSSTTDDDVLTLDADSDPDAIDVTNVERIEITWSGFGTPDVDLDNVSDATVSLTSTKSGYLGNVNFINVGSNSISVGEGVTGTVSITTIEDATITATVAEEIVVDAGDNTITIEAGIAETVSVEGGDDVIITGTSLDSIVITGSQDTVNLTLGVDAELTVGDAENVEGVVTINSEDDIVITLDAAVALAEIEATGDGVVDIVYNDSDDVDGDTISIGGSVTLGNAVAVALDLSAVESESIIFASTSAALTHTLANSADVAAAVAFGAAVVLEMDAEDDGTTDTISFTTSADQAAVLTFTDFETVTLVNGGDAEDAEGITFLEVDLDSESDTTLVLESSGEADLTITTVTASEIDASAVSTGLTLGQSAEDLDLTVIGGEGDSDITFAALTAEVTFVSEGDGDNTITAETLTVGSLAVITGGGDDTVTVDDLTTGDVSLDLGDGDNSFSILAAGNLAAAEIVVTMGDGDDEFVVVGAIDAESTVSVDLGDGENTLDLSDGADLTDGDVSIDGITVLDIGTAGDDDTADGIVTADEIAGEGDVSVFVDGDLLDGATVEITANGLDGDDTLDSMLGVEIDSEGSYDYSNLVMATGISDAVGGLLIFFSSAEDVALRMSDAGDYSDASEADVTYSILAGDSVASTDSTFAAAATMAEGDEIVFAMGVDVIDNFEVEGDFINFVNGDGETLAVTGIGADAEDLDEDTIFFLSGAWDTDTMTFTIAADGEGADTLVFENQDTAAMDTVTTATNMVVLIGIDSDDLTAGMFI